MIYPPWLNVQDKRQGRMNPYATSVRSPVLEIVVDMVEDFSGGVAADASIVHA
jgi:hypothetical protein